VVLPGIILSGGSLFPSTSAISFSSPLYLFPPDLSLLSPPITPLSALSAFSPNLSTLSERDSERKQREIGRGREQRERSDGERAYRERSDGENIERSRVKYRRERRTLGYN